MKLSLRTALALLPLLLNAWPSVLFAQSDAYTTYLPYIGLPKPVLTDGASATWAIDYTCSADRCSAARCKATEQAAVTAASTAWATVRHEVAWQDPCSGNDSWAFEVSLFTSAERTGRFRDPFIYNYWPGAQSGPATKSLTLPGGRQVPVTCARDLRFEQEEGSGWTGEYTGETCHDLATGILVSMSYTKRWLYTGVFGGVTYTRAYLGDHETLVRTLVETDLNLSNVQARPSAAAAWTQSRTP